MIPWNEGVVGVWGEQMEGADITPGSTSSIDLGQALWTAIIWGDVTTSIFKKTLTTPV